MSDRFFRAVRVSILVVAATAVSAFTMLQAQEPPPSPPPPAEPAREAPPAESPGARKPEPADAPKPLPKVFTPTQEISPDQEIDFPADL
ncbi:MAG TPA: hypothetical protein VJM11_08910 [Nevskiaceae bacterium]|nr:hypothetical protein [Nevskiaceae bacterium]